jgi:hypothetical protein
MIFLEVALSHTLLLRVLEVHINDIMGITIHITESKIHISYYKKHESSLLFYYFYMSYLLTLTHTIAKGNTFTLSNGMLQNYKKLF